MAVGTLERPRRDRLLCAGTGSRRRHGASSITAAAPLKGFLALAVIITISRSIPKIEFVNDNDRMSLATKVIGLFDLATVTGERPMWASSVTHYEIVSRVRYTPSVATLPIGDNLLQNFAWPSGGLASEHKVAVREINGWCHRANAAHQKGRRLSRERHLARDRKLGRQSEQIADFLVIDPPVG
jgi:hypothetical protein